MTFFGIAPSDIPDVKFVDAISPVEAERRLRAEAPQWITRQYSYDDGRPDDFRWDPHWLHVPVAELQRAFTHDQLIRFWFDSVIMSDVDKQLYDNDSVIWKVQNVLWQYGVARDYVRFIKCFGQLRRLSVDLPGFELRITHTRATNTSAWAWHGRDNSRQPTYLDAALGVLLFYRGEHVMTIGFAFVDDGVVVAQVQLREKKGNRFLYKLPMPYLDFALDLLRRAFGDQLWLVEGLSAVNAIRLAYKKDVDNFSGSPERIVAFYNQPLRAFERTTRTMQRDNRIFVRLRPRVQACAATVPCQLGG